MTPELQPSTPPVLDRPGLARYLARFGVETSDWGRGDTKTVDHLLEEMRNGDSELIVDGTDLTRRVRHVWVDVFATVQDERRHLVERRQVFNDGRVRERVLPTSIGEKCKVGENPAEAARRGIVEELAIAAPIKLIVGMDRQNPIGPPSYPTLRTVYDTYWFVAELDISDFKPEGYVEIQPDKRTYFEWES